jgi:hypothetical protein
MAEEIVDEEELREQVRDDLVWIDEEDKCDDREGELAIRKVRKHLKVEKEKEC